LAQDSTQNKHSEQNVLNSVYDQSLRALAVICFGFDGTNAQALVADAMATKITVSGNYTYLGIAAPGTAQSTAKWQCKRIDSSVAGTTVITWADNANFSQVATDLTSLTYS
jgi:hypothetical protein